MENELWFKRKTYGWGWTPANAKGWCAALAFVILCVAYPILSQLCHFRFSLVIFYAVIAIATAGFFWLCSVKGEKPQWSWGKRN